MTPDTRRPLLIYGSCVSRDTYEHALQAEFRLERYVARQSLISAYGRALSPPECLATAELHDFQRRMLEDDYASRFPQNLRRFLTSPGHVLMDLVDERLGVYLVEQDGYVTRSVDLITSGLDARLHESARLVRFGSDEHFVLWRSALTQLVDDLSRGRAEISVLALPWAEHDETGTPSALSFGMRASQANELFEPYVRALRDAPGVRVIQLSDADSTASSRHRWGPAPFHYADATYQAAATALRAGLSDASQDSSKEIPTR